MIRVVHPGSRIRMLTFYPFRIPDPGVKKAPDPGSQIRIRNTGIIIYKKPKGFGEHTIQSVFETLRCCWETNNSRQLALPQTKCSEGCCISVNRWESAIACWHAYKSEPGEAEGRQQENFADTSSCMCKVPVVLYFLCYLFKLWV